MGRFCVESLKVNGNNWYCIKDGETGEMIFEATKYLKHKVREHLSPNTVRKIAYALTYYLDFLVKFEVSLEAVLAMKYKEQNDHFVRFLVWLKSGNHCDRNKLPRNATCNSYLEAVFGFYLFLINEYDYEEIKLKVLENRIIGYTGTAGVHFRKTVNTFRGYLPPEKSVGRTAREDQIMQVLEKSDSLRDKLLILLAAETGFRIGEILGIRYTKDIDFEKRLIWVNYREDNENDARAKNAEIRCAQISMETFDLLQIYLSENREVLAKSEYLFLVLSGSTKGQPLTASAVYSSLRILYKRANIKLTPHMLRHYFANERWKAGEKVYMISKRLGHKHIATTINYLNIEDDEMAAAQDEFFQNHKALYSIDSLI